MSFQVKIELLELKDKMKLAKNKLKNSVKF